MTKTRQISFFESSYLLNNLVWVIKIIIIFGIFFGQNTYAGELVPYDESNKGSSFYKFREELLLVIAQKDQDSLMESLSPNIKNNFWGDGGKEEFKEIWKFKLGEESLIWSELGWILRNGGRYLKDRFCAPYVFTNWPNNFEPYDFYFAVIERDVKLREAPSTQSNIISTLNYSIVKVKERNFFIMKPHEYVRVEVHGKAGYIMKSKLRSPIDYRACFKETDEGWKLVTLIAGD